MPNGMALDVDAARVPCVAPGTASNDGRPTIVMGLDQHRSQITAEWLDTATGEVGRARIAPADRAGVRKFLECFHGLRLEAALEATTGWRFVVEELAAVGAVAHLAEPAKTSARRGNKKRAKTDRSDARHLRELLMAGRLPESWIAPPHLLDLRAQVSLRHALVDQRGEWQQRIQAVLYHHGLPQRGGLLRRENRAWVERAPLPAAAREQVTVALAMIDALDRQMAPIDTQLGALARRQPGARALLQTHSSTIMSPTRSQPGSRTEIRLGTRAHTTHTTHHANAPPRTLTPTTNTDKEELVAIALRRKA